jgi:VCBS repeat-containing protein
VNANQLKQNVIDELEFEPSIDAAHIGVAVEESVVTLTGHVATYAEKTALEEAVRRVRGVKGIAQEVVVRPAGTNLTADDEIAKQALHMLNWHVLVPSDAVQVKVEHGRLTLSGNVEWHYQRNAAADAVKNLFGVSGVTNSIRVVQPESAASDVKMMIESALKRTAEVEANAIQVTVADGTVTLEGKGKDWAERMAVERAAWSAPGVYDVEDLMTIA